MADVQEVVQNLRNIKTYLQCQAIEASANKNDVAREALIESQKDIDDALELLKTYSEILNKEPFQCKDCEYYGNKHKCPCYETKYPVLNFSCADGVRKNREWLSD